MNLGIAFAALGPLTNKVSMAAWGAGIGALVNQKNPWQGAVVGAAIAGTLKGTSRKRREGQEGLGFDWLGGGGRKAAKGSPKRSASKRRSPATRARQTTKKYRQRPGPPYAAQAWCGEFRYGNDGNVYVSRRNAAGVCTWRKSSSPRPAKYRS